MEEEVDVTGGGKRGNYQVEGGGKTEVDRFKKLVRWWVDGRGGGGEREEKVEIRGRESRRKRKRNWWKGGRGNQRKRKQVAEKMVERWKEKQKEEKVDRSG